MKVLVVVVVVLFAFLALGIEASSSSSSIKIQKSPATAAKKQNHNILADVLKPTDHCCTIGDNIKCGQVIYKCANECDTVEHCIACMGELWTACCCCLDNAGVHIIRPYCPQCCGSSI